VRRRLVLTETESSAGAKLPLAFLKELSGPSRTAVSAPWVFRTALIKKDAFFNKKRGIRSRGKAYPVWISAIHPIPDI